MFLNYLKTLTKQSVISHNTLNRKNPQNPHKKLITLSEYSQYENFSKHSEQIPEKSPNTLKFFQIAHKIFISNLTKHCKHWKFTKQLKHPEICGNTHRTLSTLTKHSKQCKTLNKLSALKHTNF
jgi:hypothetical protein